MEFQTVFGPEIKGPSKYYRIPLSDYGKRRRADCLRRRALLLRHGTIQTG